MRIVVEVVSGLDFERRVRAFADHSRGGDLPIAGCHAGGQEFELDGCGLAVVKIAEINLSGRDVGDLDVDGPAAETHWETVTLFEGAGSDQEATLTRHDGGDLDETHNFSKWGDPRWSRAAGSVGDDGFNGLCLRILQLAEGIVGAVRHGKRRCEGLDIGVQVGGADEAGRPDGDGL